MGQLAHFPAVPPMPAVARILSHYDRAKVEAFIEVAIGLLDTLDGDPDAETDDPDLEANGDDESGAYAEWHTLRAVQRKQGQCLVNAYGSEDDEDDDSDCGHDEGEPDFARRFRDGPGCPIADPDRGENGE